MRVVRKPGGEGAEQDDGLGNEAMGDGGHLVVLAVLVMHGALSLTEDCSMPATP